MTTATARLKGLRNGTAPWFAEMPGRSPTIGAIGRISASMFGRQPIHKVTQVIDGQNMLIKSTGWARPWLDFWVKGVLTKDIVDGETLTIPGVFEITGTRTYETVLGGSKTVFVLEPVDLTPYLRPKIQRQR